jgi:hypothetical protein
MTLRLKESSNIARLAVTLTALVAVGFLTALNGCSGGSSVAPRHHRPRPTPTSTATPLPPAACSGQGLIAIDPVANVGYVPVYTLDGSGNAQLAVVDLTVGAANPVVKEISLVGSDQPLATTYNPNNKTVLALGLLQSSGALTVYEIDTASQAVTNTVALPTNSITGVPYRGGIVEDITNNRAFIAGASLVGILDTSVSPPVWNAGSVVDVSSAGSFFDSFSLNIKSGTMFISGDGSNAIIDTTVAPMVPQSFDSSFGVTDGNAFDPATNIMLLSQEVGADQSWVFNFATLQTATPPASALNVLVPGLGEAPPVGEGPGGMAVINCTTHQGVIADEFGQNLKLVQLPVTPITGAPDNKGQPGTGTTPDANSAYTIAAALIPMGSVNGTQTQLGMVGDPNSLSVDPVHNFMYALADATPYFHVWQPNSTTPLFLVRVDLSAPVVGASPTGGVDGHTFWTPNEQAIPLP